MNYTNFHAQFVFILLDIYIQMYFRIYKALNVLFWMIPCKKKYWRDGGNTPFQHAISTRLEKNFLYDINGFGINKINKKTHQYVYLRFQ